MEDPEACNLIYRQTELKKSRTLTSKEQEAHDLSLVRQMWEVAKTVTPKTTTTLLFQAPFVINLVYAGHFDDQAKLSGLALSYALLNAILLYALVGLNATHETLIRKAFEEGDLKICG